MMLLLVSHKLKFVIKILIADVLISVQSSLFPEHPNPAMRARMGGPHPGASLLHIKIIKIIELYFSKSGIECNILCLGLEF